MSIWYCIFGPTPGEVPAVEIRPSGLLMNADGWYYEESLDVDCPRRTIRIQQDRPGDWYVAKTDCRIVGLNSPSRAAEVLRFFTGSLRWLRFERDQTGSKIKIIGTFLDTDGIECESHLGFVEPEAAEGLLEHDIRRLWGRIRCIRPPGAGRRPTFCLRFDLLVELDEKLFDHKSGAEPRPEDFLPLTT